jgi:hypothetical protein
MEKMNTEKENFDPPALTSEEQQAMTEMPSFYKYREAAEIMMQHEMFVKDSKNRGKQWQIDDLALKLEHCKALGIPSTFANSLYPSNGRFNMSIDVMSWIVTHKAADAEFLCTLSNEKMCIIMCRRTKVNKEAKWIPVTYTIEMARANGLVKGVHWNNDAANMINKNAYAHAYRTVCRVELANAYIPEEIPTSEMIITPEAIAPAVSATEMKQIVQAKQTQIEEQKLIAPELESKRIVKATKKAKEVQSAIEDLLASHPKDVDDERDVPEDLQ